jgi:hypothetical protein
MRQGRTHRSRMLGAAATIAMVVAAVSLALPGEEIRLV